MSELTTGEAVFCPYEEEAPEEYAAAYDENGGALRRPLPLEVAHLRPGDLFGPRDGERAEGVYAVGRAGGAKFAAPIADDYGHGEIPRCVAACVADPRAFYEAYRLEHDLARVCMCAAAHSALLAAAAGGRPLAANADVTLEWGPGRRDVAATVARGPEWGGVVLSAEGADEEEGASYNLLTPKSPDLLLVTGMPVSVDDGGSVRLRVPLNAHTPAEYLAAPDSLESDPLAEAMREHNRRLPLPPGPSVGESIPYAKVVVRRGRREEACFVRSRCREAGRQTDGVLFFRSDAVTFRPSVLTDRGPLGGVTVWGSHTSSSDGTDTYCIAVLGGLWR